MKKSIIPFKDIKLTIRAEDEFDRESLINYGTEKIDQIKIEMTDGSYLIIYCYAEDDMRIELEEVK